MYTIVGDTRLPVWPIMLISAMGNTMLRYMRYCNLISNCLPYNIPSTSCTSTIDSSPNSTNIIIWLSSFMNAGNRFIYLRDKYISKIIIEFAAVRAYWIS